MTPEERAARAIERTGASAQQREAIAIEIREAVEEEREACAQVVDSVPWDAYGKSQCIRMADAIRDRS